jgi:CheY-like chemotaxis protein
MIRHGDMRVLVIHWKPEEAAPRLELLRRAGFDATVLAPNGSAGLKGTTGFPNVIVIDLSRLPMQGRAVAIELRKRAATRRVPIVFAGGSPDKLESIRALLPDATYSDWADIVEAIRHAARTAPEIPIVPDTMAGYSGSSLPKKLGIREGILVALVDAPDGFESKLDPLPDGARIVTRPRGAARAILFVTAMSDLDRRWRSVVDSVAEGATVWIAWQKKASGITTDASEKEIRAYGLERGWVDYKICSIDETWSGLAFSKRKAARAAD